VIVYDAEDGKMDGAMSRADFLKWLHGPRDKPVLGVARLADPSDKYLLKWTRQNNPVLFDGNGGPFPSQIWKNGDYWNMLATTCPGGGNCFFPDGRGARYQSNDSSFHSWKNMGTLVDYPENGKSCYIPFKFKLVRCALCRRSMVFAGAKSDRW
jgi:hypothetical protein